MTRPRPIHPADFVKQAMAERRITADDLLAAGCDSTWLHDALRRREEIPVRDRRLTGTMRALTKATGIPLATWVAVQERWHDYSRQNFVQRQRHLEVRRAHAEQQWREIANRGPAPGPTQE